MSYPTDIPTMPSVTDNVDYPKASDINTLSQNLSGVMNTLDTNFGGSTPAQGDILYRSASGEWTRLAAGTDGQVLETQGAGANPQWVDSAAAKGRVVFHTAHTPTTLGAGVSVLAGGSTPAEQFAYYVFPNTADNYREFKCSLEGYNGGGLTFKFQVLRSSAAAGETYIFDMAIRRMNSAAEELGASHSYAYNSVTITVPAGPPAATIPMLGTITFTDGADMDSLADDEFFILRVGRDVDDTATDSALMLMGIIGRET
jgi:hypothetical protein